MKVFFIGSVRFSEKILKTLIDLNAEIVGISSIKNSKLNSDSARGYKRIREPGIASQLP